MPTPEDNKSFEGDNRYIITYPTGTNFYLYGTDPNELQYQDIVHSLSNQCRWTGHVKYFYSVLEHELFVSDIIAYLGGDKNEQFEGLMHDTSETWLSDFAAPWKGDILNYHDHEERIWRRIADKWDLPYDHSEIVKRADWLALFVEASTIVTDVDHLEKWVGWKEYGPQALSLPHIIYGYAPPSPTVIRPMSHLKFINRFEALGGKVDGHQ